MMSDVPGITTHVLDTSSGGPAVGVEVALEVRREGGWEPMSDGVTGADGRSGDLVPSGVELEVATYRIRFGSGSYFAASGVRSFYPEVDVQFEITEPAEHHHVPLLLSPFGYSTYRGT
jgi:5-hydroxyisourate hydrolase